MGFGGQSSPARQNNSAFENIFNPKLDNESSKIEDVGGADGLEGINYNYQER